MFNSHFSELRNVHSLSMTFNKVTREGIVDLLMHLVGFDLINFYVKLLLRKVIIMCYEYELF